MLCQRFKKCWTEAKLRSSQTKSKTEVKETRNWNLCFWNPEPNWGISNQCITPRINCLSRTSKMGVELHSTHTPRMNFGILFQHSFRCPWNFTVALLWPFRTLSKLQSKFLSEERHDPPRPKKIVILQNSRHFTIILIWFCKEKTKKIIQIWNCPKD